MGRHPNNKVWEYFDYISDGVAQCRECNATILTQSNKRHNMVRHLFHLHGINTYKSGPKVGLIGKPTSTKKIQRNLKKCIKKAKQSYIIREGNDERTETYDESNEDESLNNDQQYASEDDSVLENDSNRLTQHEHISDPLLNVLKIEEPVVEDKCNRNVTQFNKNELKNVTNGSAFNEINSTNGTSSLSCYKLTHLEPPQLLPEKSVAKEVFQNEAEMLKATALAEKLKAEARYFNELADLTRSKRIYVDLQCQQLRNQIASTTTGAKIANSVINISTDSLFPMDVISPTSDLPTKI